MSTTIPVRQPFIADWSIDLAGSTPVPGEKIILIALMPDPADPSDGLELSRFTFDLGGEINGVPVLQGIVFPVGGLPVDIAEFSCGAPTYPELDMRDLNGQLLIAENLDAPASGAVSDGSSGPPLLIAAGPTGELELSWSDSCYVDDTDYRILRGQLGDFDSHVPVACGTGGSTSAIVDAGPDSYYFLIVPTNGQTDGSYGVNSAGEERGMGPEACIWQKEASCP